MPRRLNTFLELLAWSTLLVSVFWTADFLLTAAAKFAYPQRWFQTWHFPELIVFFGLIFTAIAIVIGEIIRLFPRSEKHPPSEIAFPLSTALVILFYLLTAFNLRIAISGLSLEFQQLHGMDLKIVLINLIIFASFILCWRFIKKLTRYFHAKIRRLKIITLSALIVICTLHYALMEFDLNKRVFGVRQHDAIIDDTNPEKHPHVLLVVLDNLRCDYVGIYGDTLGLTPNIDKIASEGAVFLNHYSTSPWTTPGFASIYTSMNPYKILAIEDQPEISRGREGEYFFYPVNKIKPETPSLTSILSENGYQVYTFQANYQAGVKFNFHLYNDFFLSCYNKVRHANLLYGACAVAESVIKSLLKIDHDFYSPLFKKALDNYCAFGENLADYAINILKKSGSQSSLTIVNFMDVHEYSKRYPRDENLARIKSVYSEEYLQLSFAANTAYCDRQIGKIYDFLRDSGRLDNTVLVIMSDHGEQFGEHGAVGEHGFSVYNEEIKVPLVIRYPEKIPPGTVFSELSSHLDLLPVILGLCDISAAGYEFEGVDLLSREPGERSLFAGMTMYTKDKNALLQGDYKMIYDSFDGSTKFFDLINDPGEQSPARLDSSEISLLMNTRLEEFIHAAKNQQEDLLAELAAIENSTLEKDELKSIGYIK